DELLRQSLNLCEIDPQARRPQRRVFDLFGQLVEFEKVDQLGQIDAAVQFFELLLKVDVFQLLVLEVLAERVELDQPFLDDRPDGLGKQVAAEERLNQPIGHQRANELFVERST